MPATKEFGDALTGFLDEVQKVFNHTNIWLLRQFLGSGQGCEIAQQTFVEKIVPHTRECEQRDARFLARLETLFPESFRVEWSDVWESVDEDSQTSMWEWLDYLVEVASPEDD